MEKVTLERFDVLTELGAFMRTEFLCVSVLRVASGPRVKLASCKSALNPPVVYSTDRSKAVVPVLVLLFVALWFILRGDLYVFPCVILFLCVLVLLVLRLPRLGKSELILVLFRTFVRFVLVWICRFPLPLGVWEGLRFVIVALPGLFSYLFLCLLVLIYASTKYYQNISNCIHKIWLRNSFRGGNQKTTTAVVVFLARDTPTGTYPMPLQNIIKLF